LVALVVGLGLWNPLRVKAGHDRDHVPRFRVDTSWPKELPAPTGYNVATWPTPTPGDEFAHRWVQGEVAGSCTDQYDNVYTFNRAWQVGATVNGVLQNNQSGAINGNDATAAKALPSPPVVAFAPDGRTIKERSFGNTSLWTTPNHGAYTGTSAIGRSSYMPYGPHGCFVDYQGYLWVGGNGDGVIQKYNPAVAGPAGAAAAYVLQIGQKDDCDTTTGVCTSAVTGANVALNSSTTKLNEPPDIAVDPTKGPVSGCTGDIYVADGYGNYRVVVFNPCKVTANNPTGYVGQWGTACGHPEVPNGTTHPDNPCPFGTFGPGAGHPHCVVLGNDGLVYVCDRPNGRIQVFEKTCAAFGPQPPPPLVVTNSGLPNSSSNQAICTPKRVVYINNFPDNYPTVTSPKIAAVLSAATRSCDLDLYPNVDYLAGTSPTHQKYIVNVDLDGDNTYILEKPTSGTGDVTATTPVLGSIGKCGLGPCPGHNAGEFAYSHSDNVDSKGNVYVAETITGRRIQRFVPVGDDDHDRDHDHH
jgi:hypothetical protein